MIRMMV